MTGGIRCRTGRPRIPGTVFVGLEKFQKDKGLNVDGVAKNSDRKTGRALNRAMEAFYNPSGQAQPRASGIIEQVVPFGLKEPGFFLGVCGNGHVRQCRRPAGCNRHVLVAAWHQSNRASRCCI